jgi:hypothetical protein
MIGRIICNLIGFVLLGSPLVLGQMLPPALAGDASKVDSTIIVGVHGRDADNSDLIPGTALLRVQLLSTGTYGQIAVVSARSKEVGDQAIADIKRRAFRPESRNGVAIDVVKTIFYSFSITYDEGSSALKQKARITSQPPPDFSNVSIDGFVGEKIAVLTVLRAEGSVSDPKPNGSDLPPSIVKAVLDAVRKIQFEPAVHKSGRKAAQAIELVYEVK